MIETIAVMLVMIAWLILVTGAVIRFGDRGATDIWAWFFAGLVVWISAWAINAMLEYEQDNPCVAYETQLQYNASYKRMMPMRVCVECVEWEVGNE